MRTQSQRPKRRDGILSSLDTAIDAMNIAKDVMDITPAKAVFSTVGVVLTMIRVSFPRFHAGRLLADVRTQDSMINEADYVDLGLACADVCGALSRGMDGRRVDELNQSVFEAIGQLTA